MSPLMFPNASKSIFNSSVYRLHIVYFIHLSITFTLFILIVTSSICGSVKYTHAHPILMFSVTRENVLVHVSTSINRIADTVVQANVLIEIQSNI